MTLKEIQKHLLQHSTVEAKSATQKFVPSASKIYGNKMPLINELADTIAKQITESLNGFTLIKQLWEAGAYEEKILAAKLIRKYCKKEPLLSIQLVIKFSADIDNWAICDTIGMQSLKPINKKYKKEIFELSEKLSASRVMWQRRLSLVLLEDFCKQKDLHREINTLIQLQKNDGEYYVKKAVVWLEASMKKHQYINL